MVFGSPTRLAGWLRWWDRALSGGFLFRGSQVFNVVASVVLFLLIVVNFVGVVGRKSPWAGVWLMGGFEISELLMAVMCALAVAYCWYTGGHIRIGLFRDRCRPRTKAILDAFSSFIMAIWVAAVTWGIWNLAQSSRVQGWETAAQHIPIAPFVFIFCLVMAHFSLVSLRSGLGFVAKSYRR